MVIIMKTSNQKPLNLPVTFVGIKEGEPAPHFAVYQIDTTGRPTKKVGGYDGKALSLGAGVASVVAFGPDVEEFSALPKDSLASFRVSEKLDLWRKQGVVLSRDIWGRFHFHYACVSGTVQKCRPWYWDLLDNVRLQPMFELAQIARIKPITAELRPHILFPLNCQPVCDGVISIYERECCCHHIHIPDLLDRLREILDVLPIPIPDPIPEPIPRPFPIPEPFADNAPLGPQLLRARARTVQQRKTSLDLSVVPPELLHHDYLALRTLPVDAAHIYVHARPYLYPIFCHCSTRKVGETPIQPGGNFDFCYLRVAHLPHSRHCVMSYAFKIRQLVNGVLTVVYDGLAANEYFSAGTIANIRTYNPQARACADGPGDPPPNDGAAFVMLEHVGRYGTFHFNYPAQTAVSQVAMLDANDGTYTTSYAPDCPWGGALGLRLWFSPELEPTVKYYRLKVFAVNASGSPTGIPLVLADSVSWDKLIDVPGDVVRAPELLGPIPAADIPSGESNLFRVPYWGSPNHRYLSGQFHQVWNTAEPRFSNRKYMLVIEVFDANGDRVKPNGADGPGTARPFQFRRWMSATDTDPVPFADAAHVFWLDNTPVGGDIVDLRQNGIANSAECQFMTQLPGTTSNFSIGFRAFHVNGVEDTGLNDSNSFMWKYDISWQRGLNGATGSLGPAPSGGNNHTDVGESGVAVPSGNATFASMLGGQSKCTFSVTLRVYAKHFTGSDRIDNYDYRETASFALEVT